ncbi:ankyrin repeat domain-containing protein 49 isoform X2 [Frankliniella occidentalis]|uniref:Ankyrin repeat domain-containing protein 49 isoform X2 n=1 Tax=Frankliniella occidentalis TaxID=133901 RepID=A0A6J1RWJ3_FRAOC|nr:ankyrin repeat domain-containing protein 49 isoform X2 [Frankliniella occidentalis]
MDSDEQPIDSEEETERLKNSVYEAQKVIQEAGAVDEEAICERLQRKSQEEGEVSQDADDAVPLGVEEEEILTAAEKGKLDVLERLLAENENLVNVRDSDGYTPLHRACYSNHADVVEFLLKHKADVKAKTCDGWTPLHSASKWNNYKWQTPLHLASSHPEARETLYLLLTNPKISINIRNKTGELAYDIAHRHCKYYKLFDLCDPCFNII